MRLIDLYYKERSREQFIPGKSRVQYSGPIFDQEEVKAVLDSLLDGWLAAGKRTAKFEKLVADLMGGRGCVTVNSGSSALLVAWAALKNQRLRNRLQDGDEVITAALTHPATINCLLQNNLKPVLVDIDLDTLNFDVSQVEEAISQRTRGILPLHFLGNPCDMAPLMELARKHDLFVVEDCCDAYGGEYDGRRLGSFGDMATASFYAAHTLTTGEGGAVVYNHPKYRPILRSLRSWGVACATCNYSPCRVATDPAFECPQRFDVVVGLESWDRRYLFLDIGYNLKMVEMQAAFGLEQMRKVTSFVEKRRENWEYLVSALSEYQHYLALQRPTPKSQPAWFAVALTVKPEAPFTRGEIVRWLEEHQIETRPFFAGDIRDQPAYKGIPFRTVGGLENTRHARDGGFFIGCYPGITAQMREYMLSVFHDFMQKYGAGSYV